MTRQSTDGTSPKDDLSCALEILFKTGTHYKGERFQDYEADLAYKVSLKILNKAHCYIPYECFLYKLEVFQSLTVVLFIKFKVSQCDKSLAAGFIPINTWQQRASMPFKPAQRHCLQVKILSLMFYMK